MSIIYSASVAPFAVASLDRALTELVKRYERKLARYASKGLCCELPTWKFGKAEKTRSIDGSERISVPFTLEGTAPSISGWDIIALIDHSNEGNVISTLNGNSISSTWRTASPDCEHCGHKRNRHTTYLLRNANCEIKQVGSTCITDFAGGDSGAVSAIIAQFDLDVQEMLRARAWQKDFSGYDGSFGGTQDGYYLENILAKTLAFLRATGLSYVSKAKASASEMASTSSKVLQNWEKIRVTEEDYKKAQEIEAWAESITDEQVDACQGDYLHNVRIIARRAYVSDSQFGIACSIVAAHARATTPKEAPFTQAYIGNVGKRETFTLTLMRVSGYQTQYGVTTVLTFRTDEGACVVWKASNTELTQDDIGNRYSVTGRVEKHSEYVFQGGGKQAQTLLSRCKVALLEAKAKPVVAKEEPKAFDFEACVQRIEKAYNDANGGNIDECMYAIELECGKENMMKAWVESVYRRARTASISA